MAQQSNRSYIRDGLYYNSRFINPQEKSEILKWLTTIYPIWEQRYSESNPPPAGDEHRELLRPVYWLGNWQFACLNYYHPPLGINFRCVEAENYPVILKNIIKKIEETARRIYKGKDLPKDWELNTCLINFYGDKIIDGKKVDTARVGEHKDFEPGPVASLSLGDRAMFQFVRGSQKTTQNVVMEQWLDDSSLQIFGTDKWKTQYFHRVQRVDKKRQEKFSLNTDHFETRRINFTFRYVPRAHIIPFKNFPTELKADIFPYVEQLSSRSPFFKQIITEDNSDNHRREGKV